ncbi:aminoacyl tRNA synthase complex-interacting multifunctional protein 2-like [Physella acuta]|uniref:aminoacyl tRNA synthase complex-interacting multifunctional protein 2-like n=1 Tax=Physella acuta TaxID=109671 RepID=UPI0027DE03F3|nr:aminoacyl tRNA synthase complex-interacting multifunctional protein 2-like [Physella acuta]
MGNVVSRCAQNLRNALKTCSKKRPEEEAMLSTFDSEPLEKCQESVFDQPDKRTSRSESQSSLVRLEEKIEPVDCKIAFTDLTVSRAAGTPGHTAGRAGYRKLQCSDSDDTEASDAAGRRFVDRASQTNMDPADPASLEPTVFSKEYIVKTYRIKNATPSPATQPKFPPANHSSSLPQSLVVEQAKETDPSHNTPLANLERRQDDVLKRLEQLQQSVTQLSRQYNVSETTLSSHVSTCCSSAPKCQPNQSLAKSGSALDLVISVDPASIPLSLIALCESLSKQYTVFKSTYIHSSVSNSVPEKLQTLLTSNGTIKRGDSQIAISLVWKKVSNGPELMVDPTRQTVIQGEANVARYLARLLYPDWDDTNIFTTQVDDLLDTAQLQILEGNSKEKAAAVRTLNSALGKRDWLLGSEPSLADVFCWSALHQTSQVAGSPNNVKKWLKQCQNHPSFECVAGLVAEV